MPPLRAERVLSREEKLSEKAKSTGESPASKADRPAGRSRRPVLRSLFTVVAVVFLVLAAGTGALFWSLSGEGIGSGWLGGRIEAELRHRLPHGAEVEIGKARAYWEAGSGIVLEGSDVSFSFGPAVKVTARSVAITSPLPGFGRDWIRPERVRVSQVAVTIDPPEAADSPSRAARLRSFARGFAQGFVEADTAMREVGFRNFEVRDIEVRLPNSALSSFGGKITEFSWQPFGADRSKLWLQASAAGGFWTLTVERNREDAADIVEVSLADLPLGALAPTLTNPQTPQSYDGTLQLRTALRLEGKTVQAVGEVGLSPGLVVIDEDGRFILQRGQLDFALPPHGDRILINRAFAATSAGNFRIAGVLDLPAEEEPVRLRARMPEGILFGPNGTRQPLRGDFALALDAAGNLSVDRATVSSPEGAVSILGGWKRSGDSPGLALALSGTEMSTAFLSALWPSFIAPGAIEWLRANVKEGMVGPATLQIALPPDHLGPRGKDKVLPPYALSGTVPFKDARFTPTPELPEVKGASGTIQLADATATVSIASAEIGAGSYPSLSGAGSLFVVPELGGKGAVGDLTLRLVGPVDGLAALSNAGPLDVAEQQGVIPSELSGKAELSLIASIPLSKNASLLSVVPQFQLALSDFSSSGKIQERSVTDGNLSLSGTPDDYRVQGKARLDGIEATLDMTAGTGKGASDVALVLDGAARKRLGIDTGEYLSGPVTASVSRTEDGADLISLDLTQARVRFPSLSWEKGPGVGARAEFRMVETDKGRQIRELSVMGEGFHAAGSLTIDEKGNLGNLELTDVALRPGDDFSVKASSSGGGLDVSVTGKQLDARGLVRTLKENESGSQGDMLPMKLKIDVAQVKGENGIVAHRVAGSADVRAGRLHALRLNAIVGAGSLEWIISEDANAREQVANAGDAGAVLQFADLYSRVRGGRLLLSMKGPPGGEQAGGEVVVHDFRIVEETTLAEAVRPVTRSNTRAREEIFDKIDTNDIGFSKLRIPFALSKGVVTIDEAYLRGPILGATASGTINLTDSKIALSGTFIPAFGINNLAGSIPIFGQILGGGHNGGLVGVTFKLYGPLDNPVSEMNLMSAIAPGIFRRIFEYR
ncbi:AsmA-like C-terminal domain-containing protein [Afifella sp. IM 167]|uniref:YhdP family protein n=1 Tax=Afifella sp. IM 167 TaxID=2033586 RepID=UPI001CC98B48|nr:AsmA-like C-terminal domain-containing protein [Afifella sp. IM 167]